MSDYGSGSALNSHFGRTAELPGYVQGQYLLIFAARNLPEDTLSHGCPTY